MNRCPKEKRIITSTSYRRNKQENRWKYLPLTTVKLTMVGADRFQSHKTRCHSLADDNFWFGERLAIKHVYGSYKLSYTTTSNPMVNRFVLGTNPTTPDLYHLLNMLYMQASEQGINAAQYSIEIYLSVYCGLLRKVIDNTCRSSDWYINIYQLTLYKFLA